MAAASSRHLELFLPGDAAPAANAPAQPRSVVTTPGTNQVSVAFAAPLGQSLLVEPFTGSINPRWTVDGTGTTSIVSDKLREAVGVSQYARALLVDSYPANIEIFGQITVGQEQAMFPVVVFRGNGTPDTSTDIHVHTNCYYLLLRPDTNTYSLRKNSDPTDTLKLSGTLAMVAGDTVNWLIQATGNDVNVRLWVQGTAEPAGFDSFTDSAFASNTRLALNIYGTVASTTVDWDNFRLGDYTAPAVTNYRVTLSPGGYTATGTTSPIVVTGVPIGSYTAVVEAENTVGFGPTSFTSPSFTVSASGTVARTLANVTSAASGNSGSGGSVARTLADLTIIASGGQSGGGNLAETLDNVTAVAAGAQGLTGTLAETLDAVTCSAIGAAAAIAGSLAETLDAVETASPLTDENGAVITDEFGDPILVRGAEGSHGIGGILARTLANITPAITGSVGAAATLAVTLGNVTSTTTAGSGASGTLARTLGAVTSAAAGTQGVPGSLAETLDNVTSTTAGEVTTSGSVNITLGNITSAAAGTADPPTGTIAGNLGVTLDAVTSAAAGGHGTSGTLAALLDAAVVAAGGSSVAGEITRTLDNLTSAAAGTAGEAPIDGSLSVTLANITTTSDGVSGVAGDVNRTLADLVADSAGAGNAGTVNVLLADLTLAGVGAGAIVDFQAVSIRERFHVVSIREMN